MNIEDIIISPKNRNSTLAIRKCDYRMKFQKMGFCWFCSDYRGGKGNAVAKKKF